MINRWLAFFLLAAVPVHAQLTTGIIAPSRTEQFSFGWQSNAGLPAVFPDGETTPNPWTPPTRTTICATIAPEGTAGTPVAPTDLNNAIAACAAGGVVKLSPAGNYFFNAAVNMKSNVTVRGLGGDQTFVFMPSSTGGFSWPVGGGGSSTWTAGYAQGSTSLTFGTAPPVGNVINLRQCDDGYSTTSCTGGILDPGGPYTCTNNKIFCATQGTNTNASTQVQVVFVSAVSGAGPFTVTISPGLYMSNWNSAQGAKAAWNGSSVGIGLEDMSVDGTSGTYSNIFNISFTYASWLKGVRVIGGKQNTAINIGNAKSNLIFLDYVYGAVILGSGLSSGEPLSIQLNTTCDNLILSNITEIGNLEETDGASCGDVFGYNYARAGYSNSGNQTFIGNVMSDHSAGVNFTLREGNQAGNSEHDSIHGGHNFQTDFRNIYQCDPPYTKSSGIEAISSEGYDRFANIIGNVLGCPGITTNYQSTFLSVQSNPVYVLGFRAGTTFPVDSVALNSVMRWGNYDNVNNATRFVNAEVPSGLQTTTGFTQQIGTGDGTTTTFSATLSNTPCLAGDNIIYVGTANAPTVYAQDNGTGTMSGPGVTSGSVTCSTGAVTITFSSAPASSSAININYLKQTSSASPFANPVPASHTLPPSFFLPTTAHPNGGTGLSWWKVSTNYPTNTTFQTQPFPPIGPDVTGGNLGAGFAYDIPAKIAYDHLPIDPTYQTSYAITNATCTANVATITVPTMPNGKAPVGNFQVTGMNPSGYNSPTGGQGTATEWQMTTSTTTTVSYAVPSCPGAFVSGGSFVFPDIRQFNENVFTLDPATQSISVGGNIKLGGKIIIH